MHQSKGFTLVELIMVILLLGIVSIATFSYLGFGAQIFRDVTGRDTLTAQSRFAVERLTREVRNALPGSIRVSDNGDCLEYVPIKSASAYLHIPLTDSGSSSFVAVPPYYQGNDNPDPTVFHEHYLFVYANSEPRIYLPNSTQRRRIEQIIEQDNAWRFEFTENDPFALQSPARRYYISEGPVSWCVNPNGILQRIDDYPLHADGPRGLGSPVEMARGLVNQNAFEITHFQQRHNLVAFRFYFTRRSGAEPLTVYHEVQVTNVP